MKLKAVIVIVTGFIIAITLQFSVAIDTPHNESNNVSCQECHIGPNWPAVLYWFPTFTPHTIDDTNFNMLCLSCHVESSGPYPGTAPRVKTHSSVSIDNKYGDWTRECINCHKPHKQLLKNYKDTDASNLFLAQGTITSCVYNGGNGTSTLSYSSITYKPGWDATKLTKKTSDFRRTVLWPNVNNLNYDYPITAVDAGAITVKGNATINLSPPTTFAVMYGQYIKNSIDISADGSGNYKAVKFFDQTGTNSFADGDGTYDGICEVCHTQTTHFRNDGSGSDQLHANILGAGGKNCISCHPHTLGFKVNCQTCHGYPPPPLASVPLPTGSATGGAHILHATTKGYDCSVCHYNSAGAGSSHMDKKITLGFVNIPGSYTGGSYAGQTSANYESSDAGTTVSNTGTKKCSNLYCHGGTMAPDGGTATATWDDPSSAVCGTCHGASASSPPLRGSHVKHTGSANGGRQLACTVCHSGYASNHVNGSVNWAYDTTTYTWLSGASYKSSASGSATPVPSTSYTSYGTCSNLYCHSNVQTSPPAGGALTYAAPTWGNAASGACGTCHGKDTDPDKIASGSHIKHVTTTTYNYTCSQCHNGAGEGATKHVDYNVDVAFSGAGTYNSTPTPGDAYGSCSNNYCHSNGTSVSTGTIPANTSANWGSVALACNACHGNPPAYETGYPKTNSHLKHSYGCNKCHVNTTSDGATITTAANHVNIAYNVDTGPGASFSYLFNGTGGTCSSISCHMNGSAKWGATLACSSCHGFPPATNAHLAHIQSAVSQVYGSTGVQSTPSSYAFGCGNCHPVNTASHANGAVEVSLNPADGGTLKSRNAATAGRTGSGATTVCNQIYCHSNGANGAGSNLAVAASPAWGSPLTGNKCGGCHNNPPQYANAGAGVAGANSHYVSTGFMGKEGGHMVTIHFDNTYNKVAGSGLLGTGTTVDSSHGNANVATTMACYVCHYGVVSNTTIDTYAMDGTTSSFRCGACHTGATPTPLQAGVINDKSKHVSGSVNVTFAPITMKSKAQLRTASLPAVWTRSGTYGASGSYDSTSAALSSGTWTPATKTCVVACHTMNLIQWGDTTDTCLNCHNKL